MRVHVIKEPALIYSSSPYSASSSAWISAWRCRPRELSFILISNSSQLARDLLFAQSAHHQLVQYLGGILLQDRHLSPIQAHRFQYHGEDNRVVWDDHGNPGVLLSLQADGRVALSVSTDQDPSGAGLASGQVVINTWQHIAGVYNGTQLRIFVNGQDTCIVTETSGFIIDQSSVFPGAPIRIGNTPAM
jgi:hypothetical protein